MAAVDSIIRARDNLAQLIEIQTLKWLAAGCPPTYSVEGESYDWNNWLTSKTANLDTLNKTIQQMQGPFVIRSKGRA